MPDSLEFLDAVAGLPEQLDGRARGCCGAGPLVPARGRRDRRRRDPRDGRFGDGGRRAAGRRQLAARPGRSAEAVPHTGVHRPPHARLRPLVLGEHRGDRVDGAGCVRGGGAGGRRDLRRRARRARRAATGGARAVSPGPDAARRTRRAARTARRDAVPPRHLSGGPRLARHGAAAAQASARPVPPRGRGHEEPGA